MATYSKKKEEEQERYVSPYKSQAEYDHDSQVIAGLRQNQAVQNAIRTRQNAIAKEQAHIQRYNTDENYRMAYNKQQAEAELESKRKRLDRFEGSSNDVGFWDAMLPGGATPSEYKESRQKKKQYEKEAEEAAAQVAAYEQFLKEKEIQGKTSAEIDAYLAEGDAQIEKLEEEKGSFWDAMKPGGVKPSEYNANRKVKEAEIKKIESQQGMYRAVRDEKKSREMTDKLPEDVIKLLDDYNSIGDISQANQMAAVIAPESSMMYNSANNAQAERKKKIAEELVKKGYTNYAELAEYRQYVRNVESSRAAEESISAFAKEHPVASSAMSVALSPAANIAGAVGTAENIFGEKKSDLGANPYDSWYYLDEYRNVTRQAVSETFEDGMLSAKTKGMLYNTAMSGADSALAGLTMGSAGGIMLGVGALNDTYTDVLKRGGTEEQALMSGVLAGTAEGVFEAVSLGYFFKGVEPTDVIGIAKNVLVQAGVNAQEEAATEAANILTDYLINGGLSDYYQNYENALASGMSEEEAKKYAKEVAVKQVGEAALSGALMGTGFGVIGSATGNVNYNSALKEAGKQAVNEGNVDAVLAGASDIKGNEVVSNLISEVEGIQNTAREKAKFKGKEYRTIGKLMEQLDKVTGADRSRLIETAVKKRLTELGEADNIDVKVAAISKYIENIGRKKADMIKLSNAEKKAVRKGIYTRRVLNEVSDAAGMHSSDWAVALGEDIGNLFERRYEPDVEKFRTEREVKAEEKAKALVKETLITEGQNEEDFNAGFELYYEQGKLGGYEFNEIKDNPNVSESFTDYQKAQAFEQGQHQALKDIGNARYKGDTVAVFINGYSGKDTVKRYASAFNIFYSEGMHSKMSFEEVFKREGLDKVIDEATARKAFEAGRKQSTSAQRSDEKQIKRAPKKDGSYVSKTIEEGEIDTFLEAFSKKLGLDTVRVQKIINGEDEANAQIDLKRGKMVSSASSRNEYQSTIHESAHLAYAYGDTKKMAEIETSMKDFFIHLHGAASFENVIRQYAEAYTDLDRAGVMEEFTADALAGVFSSEDGINEFVDWLQKDSGYSQAEKKTILQKLSEWLLEIVDKIRELVEEGHLNNVTEAYAKAQAEQFDDVRQKFLQVLDEIEGVEGAEGVKRSTQDKRIVIGMSDTERTEILNKKNIVAPKYMGEADVLIKKESNNFESNKIGFVKEALLRIADEFNIYTRYKIKDVDVKIQLSKSNISESVSKKITPEQIAKMLPVLKDVVENSIGIEMHENRYFYDDYTLSFANLLGGYIDGEYFIPVRFGLKNGQNNEHTLYVIVDQQKIKADELSSSALKKTKVFKTAPLHKAKPSASHLATYSIKDIVRFVKSEDLLRYLPDDMLDEEQRGIKWAAIAETIKRTNDKNDKKYKKFVSKGNLDAAKQMVKSAAKKNGYDSPVLYHGTHSFGFTEFDLDKMDDKRSIFLTSSKEIASTYSGVTGSKEIGKDNTVNVADMSAEDIVKRLNEYDAEFKTGTTEGPHNYELYDFKKTNSLISKVNDGIEKLKGIVGEEIKSYADKMARDFDDKDAKIHSQLVTLSGRLDRYDYQNLSTPIYLLLHHTDVFGGSAEIAELEKNIRLMNQVRTRDLSAGVVVDEALGGYVIEVMNIDQAREYLEQRLKAGNYSLYAKLGKSLVIDGKGALWNNISYWTNSMEVKASDVSVVKKGDFYELIDNKTKEIIDGGSVTVNEHTDKMFSSNKHELITLMVNKANNVLHIKSETAHTTRDIAKFAKERGYDSVVFKDIRDNGGWNSEIEYEELADIYVIFDPNSVKSADAVTYDNNGEVIPLSERFNSNEADIRRSRKFSLDWIDFAEEQERERSAVSELTELKKINEELRAQIRHPGVKHIVSQLGVQKVARHLKGEYMSKINIHKLAGELGDFYTLIANGDGISWDSLQIHIERIADMILDESKYKKPDISDYAKDVLRDIRSVKIKLNDEQKSEVASEYGSYNEFRKRTMGTLVLSNEGMSLDERWGELSKAYPRHFPKGTADTDQPRVLMEAVSALRETYEDMNGMDLESAKDMLMTEIYEQYFEVPETKYISEEYKLKYAKAKAEFSEKIREAKADFKKQRDEAYRKAKAEYGEILKGIREEEAEAILQAKTRYNLRAEKMADTRVREKKRANVIKQVKRLDKLLRTPGKGAPSAGTNKYEQKYVHLTNIPESLKRTVIDFCSVFIEHDAGVFSGYKKNDSVSVREKKIEALQKQYAALKKSESYLKESVNEEMAEKLDKVAEIMAERRLSELTASELDTVIEITDHLITVINNQVEMWVGGKREKVEGLGLSAVDQLTAKGQYKHLTLPGHDFVKGWGVNNMKPVYFFERVGGVLEKLFLEMQNKGQRDYARNINAAAAFMDETSKKFAYEKWTDEDPLTIKTTQGHTLKLTKSQAMHIWATAKREVIAGKDSRHIMQGGIVFEDEIDADVVSDSFKDKVGNVTDKKKLTDKVWKYKKSDGSAHRISLDDLDKISEYLTDEQKKFVDTMVGYLSNDMAALGNEVSMELYGIKRFNEKYYIPFNSAKNFIYRSMGEQGEAMLRSESFTKETTYGANNPLVVGDFLDVVAGHIERMAMYNSMVLPLENFSKIWNFKIFAPEGSGNSSTVSVRSAMETAFGKSYVSYVDTLLKDINGGINADSREKSMGRLLSNFKKTAVLGSASVVIQQPSAIVRAFAEIDPSYFVATTFAGRKKAWEKALKYSSTALLKDIGGFDTVSGRGTADWLTKKEYKGKDKVIAFFKDSQYRDDIIAWGPGFADKVTWAHIWAACEREVAHDNKGLQGEELYKKTGERFDEVINKTQVYDSVLTRSAHMRSKSNAMQAVTAFMSEPTTQANMIASAIFNAKKGDKKKAARIYSSVILSQLFNAALVSIIYAARDDDDEKTPLEEYIAELTSNFLGSLNPITMIPLFKDVWSMLEGYDIERSDMSVYSDLIDSYKAWQSDSKTYAEKIRGTIGSIGNAFGLPLKNILRDAAATVNVAKSLGDISDTTGKGIWYAIEESSFPVIETLTSWKPTTKDEKLYAAFSEGDRKMYNRIASQYTSGGKIKSDLKKQIGERFVEGDIDEQTAISQFRMLGLTENEAYYEVRSLKEPLPEEDSEDTNADFFDFDSMQGVQSNADAESGEAKGDYDWLENALATGDRSDIQKEINDLKNRGVSEDDINSKIKSWIKANDSTVTAEAERYKQGNLNSFESTVKSVSSKYGVDESSVAGAIRSAAGDRSKAIEGTIYAYGDLHASIGSVNTAQTQKIASSIINAKTEGYLSEGMTRAEAQKKAKKSVRDSLTSEWKPIYIAASSTERTRIRQQLYATGAYDNLNKLDETLAGWRKNG